MRLVDTWDDLMESASTIMGNIPDFPKQLSNNWIAPQLLDVNKKCVHVSEMQIDNFYIFSIQYWFIFLEHNYCDCIVISFQNPLEIEWSSSPLQMEIAFLMQFPFSCMAMSLWQWCSKWQQWQTWLISWSHSPNM